MTLETRAHRAAQGVHRAVEVMEMARFTKEPTILAPFERFVEAKRRNRRRGAILVAGGLALALVVIVAVTTLGNERGAPVPASPGIVGPTVTPPEPVAAGTVTVRADGCSIDAPRTIDASDGTATSALLSLNVENRSSKDAWVALVRIDTTAMTYDAFARTDWSTVEGAIGMAEGRPPGTIFVLLAIDVGPGTSDVIEGLATAGTYSVVCMKADGDGGLASDTPLGPIVLT